MQLYGLLRDNLIEGNFVVFLGAGASCAAGLHAAPALANYLFHAADAPADLSPHQSDLVRLTSRFDDDPKYTRRWVNKTLVEYFLNPSNYKDLTSHQQLLLLQPRAIITTNYDISVELAEARLANAQHRRRLVPITDGRDEAAIQDDTPGRIPYFKLHGCCRELDQHPSKAPPLVITRRDFRDSHSRNSQFIQRIKQWAYSCSIVFIGFHPEREETDYLLGNIL